MLTENLYYQLHEVGCAIFNDGPLRCFTLQTDNSVLNALEFNIISLNVDHNIDWEINNFIHNNLHDKHQNVFTDCERLGIDIANQIMHYCNADVISDYIVDHHDNIIREYMKDYLSKMVKEYNLEKIAFAQWPLWMQDFISDGFHDIEPNVGYNDRILHGGYSSIDWEESAKKEDIIVLNGIRYKKID